MDALRHSAGSRNKQQSQNRRFKTYDYQIQQTIIFRSQSSNHNQQKCAVAQLLSYYSFVVKQCSFKMFCWQKRLRSALLSSLWSYRIASTQKPNESQKLRELSKQAQRAAWATKIIRTIKQSPPEEDIYSPSLREKLMNLGVPNQSYDFDETIKQQILKAFTSGVSFDDLSFRQERFTGAREIAIDNILTIVFCPNYLVTQQMFNLIDDYSILLVCGNYGISKSISLMLYSILAKHINLYRYQALISSRSTHDKKHQIDLQQEMKTLIEENIIRRQRKFWYWTINRNIIKRIGWRSIQQSFIAQAQELSQQEKDKLQKCQNLKEFISQLIYYYPQSKIQSRIVIDQINQLATLMRKWNEFVNQKSRQLAKTPIYTQQELISLKTSIKRHRQLYFHPAKELISFFQDLTLFCDKYILNSSINIEKNLFQEIEKQPSENNIVQQIQKKLGLQLLALPLFGHHERLKQVQMAYSQNLRENWGKNDFFHFFWFQFRRVMSKINLSKDKEATAQRLFLSVAEQRKGRGFYRIIFIKDFLQTLASKRYKFKKAIEELPSFYDLKKQQIQQQMSIYFPQKTLEKMFPSQFKGKNEKQTVQKTYQEHPLTALFEEMFENFDRQCQNWEKERVKIFMKKGDYQQKLRFMMTVYYLAEQAYIGKKELKFPATHLQTVLGEDIAAHFLSEQHSQEFLPINRNININETVDFLWSPVEFIQLTIEIICTTLYKIHKTLFDSFILKANKNQPLFRGIFFELLFLYQLNPKTVIKFKNFVNKDLTNVLSTQISASLTFISFNAQIVKQFYTEQRQSVKTKRLLYLETSEYAIIPDQSQNEKKIIPYDVDLHFDEILNYCSSNVGCYISGQPFYKGVFVRNNKCVDFVLAIKKSRALPTTIYTFDLTVSTKVEKKIKDAQIFLKNLAAQTPKMFQFVHIIVAPKEACQEKIKITQNLSIQFSDVDSFEMENVTHPNEYAMIRILQEANKKLRENKAHLFK